LMVVVFFTNSILWRGFAFDFHVEMFGPLMVFGAAYFAVRAQWRRFYLALLLVLSVKEDMVFTVMALGLWVWSMNRKHWVHALATNGLALFWGVAAFKLVIPFFLGNGAAQSEFVARRYASWGTTYLEVASNLLTHPGELGRRLFSGSVIEAVKGFGWTPFFDPISTICSIPHFLLNVVSDYEGQQHLDIYYGVPAVTFLFLGLPRATLWVRKRWGIAAAIGLVLTCWLWVFPRAGDFKWPAVTREQLQAANDLKIIPRDVSISAQTSLIPHLPVSEKIRLFPKDSDSAEWIALMPHAYRFPLPDAVYEAKVGQLLARPDLGVVHFANDLLLLRRGAPTVRNADVLRALGPEAVH
jgi:hypothetical protein